MEYHEGVTFKAYLDQKKRLTPPEETPAYTGSHEPEKSKKRSKKGFIIALAPEAAVIVPTVTLVFIFDIFKTFATVPLFSFFRNTGARKTAPPGAAKNIRNLTGVLNKLYKKANSPLTAARTAARHAARPRVRQRERP